MNIDLPLTPGVGQTDTICAPCTQSGGAIAVVRVSGPQAVACVDSIFASPKGQPLSERKSHTIAFGRILDDKHEVVDEVVVSLFRGPQSYTGEDVVEISCHGSRYILHTVLDLLVNNGCRMALPGEFTQRAFLNGKMDLSQAEAVADLIASDSSASHRISMPPLRRCSPSIFPTRICRCFPRRRKDISSTILKEAIKHLNFITRLKDK